MSEPSNLINLINEKTFQSVEKAFRKHFKLPLETIDILGRPIASRCSDDCRPTFCSVISKNKAGKKRCLQDRIRSLHIAFETGQPSTTVCHAGIIFSCVPVMNQDMPLGGILLGRCLSEPFSSAIQEDMEKRLLGLRLSKSALFRSARQLPILSARTIHDAVEFLYILLYETAQLDPRVIEWKRLQSQQQSQISGHIHLHKQTQLPEKYPFQSERELIAKVKIGDKTGAREILNSLLGSILFRNPGQLNILKVRLVELLGMLSRSASEAGVDPDLLLEKNVGYINKVLLLDTQEEICAWISFALNDFIDSVYALQKPQRQSRLGPALSYIQKHYREKITLDQIARAAHLSASRLCHLFAGQMGFTVFDYIASLRIDRAKTLLLSTDQTCLQICYDSGFFNLSYFNRTFRQQTGMTPTQFRKQNLR
ncbi:MAG TPA: PocR ligand-binding domain-containing protein [Anaerohalosphaeraceae bacterium]|nr:PocR ligand-binding domain-containing protein [Anaerohalosphaeraceae bacterium]